MESAAGGGGGGRSEVIRSNDERFSELDEDKYPITSDWLAASTKQRKKSDVTSDLHELSKPTPNNNNQPLSTRPRSKSLTIVGKGHVDPVQQSEIILAALMGTNFNVSGKGSKNNSLIVLAGGGGSTTDPNVFDKSRNSSGKSGIGSGRLGNVSHKSLNVSGRAGIGSGRVAVTIDSQSRPNYAPSPLLAKPKSKDDMSHYNEDDKTREQEPKQDEGILPVNSDGAHILYKYPRQI